MATFDFKGVDLEAIRFNDLLDNLGIIYNTKGKQMIGDNFIISTDKNLFCYKGQSNKGGGIVQFVMDRLNLDTKQSATLIYEKFFLNHKPKRELPTLDYHYCDELQKASITPETAKALEVGMIRQKSIISGQIALKIYDINGNYINNIGFKPKTKDWFFPKGFIKTIYNIHNCLNQDTVILTVNPFQTVYLHSIGFKNSVSLLGETMTAIQEKMLTDNFSKILLLHNNPETITNRLIDKCFIKTYKTKHNFALYSTELIEKLLTA